VPKKITAASLPLNVCLLIDKSGSMAGGKKLENAKKGAINLITQLEGRDYAGIVAFESEVDVVVPGQHVTDTSVFVTEINKMEARRKTELYKGLETAFSELMKPLHTVYGPGKEPVRRIILLSDGDPTDKKPESDYRELARKIRGTGITITALGVGEEYNEDLLSALAEESGGVWYHLTPDDIPDIFLRELVDMKTVISSQPELVLTLSEGCELTDIYKAVPEVYRISNVTKRNGEHRIPISDIAAGESQTFVARIAVPPRPKEGYTAAQITLINGHLRVREDITVNYSEDKSLWSIETDPLSRTLFAVAETQMKVKSGLSGDETALTQAETQLKTLLKDPDVTKVREVAERTGLIKRILTKIKKGMNKEEKKKAKAELTRIGRVEHEVFVLRS